MAKSRETPAWLQLGQECWREVGGFKLHVQLESVGLADSLMRGWVWSMGDGRAQVKGNCYIFGLNNCWMLLKDSVPD